MTDLERVVEEIRRWGYSATGVTEEQVGLARLREVAADELGDKPSPWFLGCRVVLGVA